MEDLTTGADIFSDEELKRNREDVCEMCVKAVKYGEKGIQCDKCDKWFHNSCVFLRDDFVEEHWCCPYCLKGGVIMRKNLNKNLFEKKEFENFVNSLPYYCEVCDLAFETNDDFEIHKIGHEIDGHKKKKSNKTKVVRRKSGNRSKKNKKIIKRSRRGGGGGKKKKN